MTINDLVQAFTDLVQSNQALALGVLIVANLVAGVLNAAKDGKIELGEIGGIAKRLISFGSVFIGLGTVSEIRGDWLGQILTWLTTAITAAPFAKGMIKNGLEIVGLNVPAIIDRAKEELTVRAFYDTLNILWQARATQVITQVAYDQAIQKLQEAFKPLFDGISQGVPAGLVEDILREARKK